MQFVRGSRAKDAPHEAQYVLRKALSHWIESDDVLISSAALENLDFFISLEDTWDFVSRTIAGFNAEGYHPLVVRIGSPEVYKHRPIFCIPLFHELGHFVDHHFKISEYSLIVNPPAARPEGIDFEQWRRANLSYRMEYFADLFSACYCGEAANLCLQAIAPSAPDTPTHPATQRRISVVAAFLAGESGGIVSVLQEACVARTGKELSKQFSVPKLQSSFDDVLTYRIANQRELFGIFPAGWEYLARNLQVRSAPWIDAHSAIPEIERTVNDLVEKSIRNFEVRERWEHGVNN